MNLAKMIYDSYPGAKDLDLTEGELVTIGELYRAVSSRNLGDTLFTFVVKETHDVYDPTDDKKSLKEMVRAMKMAISQLSAIQDTADNELYRMDNKKLIEYNEKLSK
jgi:hypothetical protein